MQQNIQLKLEFFGEGRSFKISTVFLKVNSWLSSWYYGSATLIGVAELSLGSTGFINSHPSRIYTDLIRVETPYDYELPVRFYVVNKLGYPIKEAAQENKFIEVVDYWEIEEVRGLPPLTKVLYKQKIDDKNLEEYMTLGSKSYIPTFLSEKEFAHKDEKQLAQYDVIQINQLIDIAKGGLILHLHSPVQPCDNLCSGYHKREQNKTRRILEEKGISWEKIETENPYSSQKIEILYQEYQKQKIKNERGDINTNLKDTNFSTLVINSLFRPRLLDEEIQEEDDEYRCCIL